MLLQDVVKTSNSVARADGRLEKVDRLAALLRRLDPEDVPTAVAYLSGELPQGKIGVGPATLDEVLPVPPAGEATLELSETRESFGEIQEISGSGARQRREERLTALFRRATSEEQDFLVRLLLGELRQGAQEGLVAEAVAAASDAEPAGVRRAVTLTGQLGTVARRVLSEGPGALEAFGLQLFRPVRPMLAETASDTRDALARLGRAAFEYKMDGARVQVHKDGDRIRIFTRRLNEKTGSLPDVVEALRSVEAGTVVLDGEVLSLDEDGRPRRFQETMRRFGRTERVEALRQEIPLTPFLFDCLYVADTSLLDRPARERFGRLREVVPEALVVPRLVTDVPERADEFYRQALRAGHEGVLAKDLDALYVAGRRGASWLKIKPEYTADLVVLAAEWGHGRRRGWLSNLHLGARDPDAGEFVMVGKTFKGMTDEMLAWQTRKLQELAIEEEGSVVRVEPRLVIEVAFDGVQESPTYEGGLALRFARVKGYRPDRAPDSADTLSLLREVHQGRGAER